jgi:tRNA nucleotidyltransferase (CCA-adding enzyme)
MNPAMTIANPQAGNGWAGTQREASRGGPPARATAVGSLQRGEGEASSRWSHFAHGADIGVRGEGPTAACAFEQAALALTAVVTDPAGVRPIRHLALSCSAPDIELLLMEWLNTVIFAMATQGLLFCRYSVRLSGTGLIAEAWGEPADRSRHEPAAEPKGATLTELQVGQETSGAWFAQCVVDV